MSEQTPTERVEEDVGKFIDEVYRISSAHDLYLRLAKQQQVDADLLNPAPRFFSRVFEALESEIILSLSKLYEVGRSDRNLLGLVNYVQSNRGSIDWGHEEISKRQVDRHKQLLTGQEEVVENVLGLRDEFYAHHDRDHFLVVEDLKEEYPLDVENVETLLDVAESILEDYHRALTGRDITDVERMDIDRVFHALGEYYKNGDYTLAPLG